MARETGCADEAHFLPLLELPALKAMLQASAQSGVASLAKLLDWASPQLPVHLRTRGRRHAAR